LALLLRALLDVDSHRPPHCRAASAHPRDKHVNPTAVAGFCGGTLYAKKGYAMKASTFYGSEPIKLQTFDTVTEIHSTISEVKTRDFGNGEKLVLTLGDDDWSLVLNATSCRVLRAAYGDETDDWRGQPITVYKGPVRYRGNEQDGICVRVPEPAEKPAPTVAGPPKGNGSDHLQDDIPF
jgi:hypothetical protein